MASYVIGAIGQYATDQAIGAYNRYQYNNPYGTGGGYSMQYNTGKNITGGYYGFKDGGMVGKTGLAKVHKGELVVPKKDVKKVKAVMRKEKIPVPTGNGKMCGIKHIPRT